MQPLQPVLNDGPANPAVTKKSFDWSLPWSTVITPSLISLWAWGLGRFGFSILWVTLVSLLMVFSIVRQRKHFQFHQTLRFQRLMHSPAALQRSLPLIPHWISFPDMEKADFIQMICAQMWPSIKAATETTVITSIQPIFDKLKPAFLTSLSFSKFDLGNIPPSIPGVQLQQSDDGEIMLDIEVEFAGNPNINVEAKSGPAPVVVHIADFFFRSTIRVVLKPLMNEIPCFGAISISFLKRPEINFKLSTIAVPIMAIPGLNDALYHLIKDQMAEFVVWPKKLVIPIKKLSSEVLAKLSAAESEAVLSVQIRGVKDLTAVDHCYAKIMVGGQDKKTEIKKTRGGSGFLEWNESFDFIIHDPANDTIKIAIKKKENILMNTMDKFVINQMRSVTGKPKSLVLGTISYPVNRLSLSSNWAIDSGIVEQELWLPLQDQHPHRTNAQIHVVFIYKPFKPSPSASSSLSLDHTDTNTDKQPTLQRRVSARTVGSSGLLIVTIHSASGLRRHNGSAVSSVYVRVRVGDHENKTKTSIGEVLRWDQQFDLSVSDSRSQSLVLEICDKSTLHSFAGVVGMGKDHVVGEVVLPVSHIQSHGRKLETLPLEKAQGGTITITTELKETGM